MQKPTISLKSQCFGLQGFGWAIAKALAEAGAEISLGVWVSYGNWTSSSG
jgi:enoyl-[acyl-carrier-protein] reductase (NADH)